MAGFYKELVKKLKGAGYVLARQKRGSHEIWKHTETDKEVSVPKNTKSRHTVNDVLKSAGINEKF